MQSWKFCGGLWLWGFFGGGVLVLVGFFWGGFLCGGLLLWFFLMTLWAISRCSNSGGVPLGVCVCFLCLWLYLVRTEEKWFNSTCFSFSLLWKVGAEAWFLVNISSMDVTWNKVDKPGFFSCPSLINTACSSVE